MSFFTAKAFCNVFRAVDKAINSRCICNITSNSFRLSQDWCRTPYRQWQHKPRWFLTPRPEVRYVHRRNGVEAHGGRRWSNRCNCCGFNTSGDQELADFLIQELKSEREVENISDLPAVDGFKITKLEGPSLSLCRKIEGETIYIEFSIANPVDVEVADQMEFDGAVFANTYSESDEIVSKVPFRVEIEKDGYGKRLLVQCAFTPTDETASSEIDVDSLIEIEGVAVTSKLHPKSDDNFFISPAAADFELHNRLLSFLEERGIDRLFTEQFIQLCSSYEHRCYMNFLEELKDFMHCAPLIPATVHLPGFTEPSDRPV